MGRNIAQISDIQLDKELFESLKNKTQQYGYKRIAKASGLKSYQTVLRYFNRMPVSKFSEEQILKGINSLVSEPSDTYKLAQSIIKSN